MTVDPIIRQAVLERDNHQCQLDAIFGISHLSGVGCSDRLEVHHITYERYGHEVNSDLISVCSRCHDFVTSAIRALRFMRLGLDIEQAEIDQAAGVDTTKENNGNGNDPSTDDRHGTTVDAQREASRPARSGVKGTSRYHR